MFLATDRSEGYPDHAADLLNRRFCGKTGKETLVLLVDEVCLFICFCLAADKGGLV